MSLSTFAADSRRVLDAAVAAADAGAGGVAPSPVETAAPGASLSRPVAAGAEAVVSRDGEQAASRFFPDGRDDHYGAWQGRTGTNASTLRWEAAAEFGSRDFGWGGATVGGLGAGAGRGGVALDGTVARMEVELGGAALARVDAMQAGAALTTVHGDGSRGLGVNAGANALAGEVSWDRGGFRGAIGLSAGVGAGGTVGLRDADADGRTEICSSVSAGPVTVGACYEPYSIAEGVARLGRQGVGLVASLMRP